MAATNSWLMATNHFSQTELGSLFLDWRMGQQSKIPIMMIIIIKIIIITITKWAMIENHRNKLPSYERFAVKWSVAWLYYFEIFCTVGIKVSIPGYQGSTRCTITIKACKNRFPPGAADAAKSPWLPQRCKVLTLLQLYKTPRLKISKDDQRCQTGH